MAQYRAIVKAETAFAVVFRAPNDDAAYERAKQLADDFFVAKVTPIKDPLPKTIIYWEDVADYPEFEVEDVSQE